MRESEQTMPKVNNTRAQRAARLLEMIEQGPASLGDVPNDAITGEPLTAAEMRRRYRIWFESWVRPEMLDLVPELRKAERQKASKQ